MVEPERALAQVAHLGACARRPDRLIAMAGVPLDRAAVRPCVGSAQGERGGGRM
ncbi:hypothetical protein [Streptomyces sp. NPDC058295]|uniref:hypothetical protein n=1 Tax=Streptomyces sp. NPDC058295 TaxID=3346431 RepID=UPI0036E12B26